MIQGDFLIRTSGQLCNENRFDAMPSSAPFNCYARKVSARATPSLRGDVTHTTTKRNPITHLHNLLRCSSHQAALHTVKDTTVVVPVVGKGKKWNPRLSTLAKYGIIGNILHTLRDFPTLGTGGIAFTGEIFVS